MLPIGAINRHIPGDRCIHDYGLHEVLRVTMRGILGMRDAISGTTGKSAAVVVRKLFFQPIPDVACTEAKTVTKGRLNNHKANGKGKAVQFMRRRSWEALINVCLNEGGVINKRVGGRLWGDVGREPWDIFPQMCEYAWQTGWLLGGGGGA